jgi:hypothetical protein
MTPATPAPPIPSREADRIERLPPQAVEVEMAVLGAMVIDQQAIGRAREILDEGCFYHPPHGLIYQAILSLYERGEGVDQLTLAEELKRRTQLDEVGGVVYLAKLASEVATAANIKYHARIVLEKALSRKLIETAHEVIEKTYQGSEEVQDLIDWAEQRIVDLGAGRPRRRQVVLRSAASIAPRPVRWVWDDGGGRIPAGETTLTPGPGGIGKSTVHAWIMAQITHGQLPGVHHGTPRACIICATEDSWARTIVPRLIAASADLDLVYRVDVVESGRTMRLTLPADLGALEEAIRGREVALVSLDPLMTLVSMELDTHVDRDVRQALEPLSRLADATGCAILANAHFNKGGSADPLMRITGSAAIGQVVRCVLAFGRDEEAGHCVLSVAKNNLGRMDLPSLAYRVESATIETDEGPASVGRLVWCGRSERSVSDLLRPAGGEEPTVLEEAVQWLLEPEILGEGQERLAADIYGAASSEKISERTLRRAAQQVCQTRREGFGGKVWWKLDKSILAKNPHTGQPQKPGQNEKNVASMGERETWTQ